MFFYTFSVCVWFSVQLATFVIILNIYPPKFVIGVSIATVFTLQFLIFYLNKQWINLSQGRRQVQFDALSNRQAILSS